jgi:hypothetical protein
MYIPYYAKWPSLILVVVLGATVPWASSPAVPLSAKTAQNVNLAAARSGDRSEQQHFVCELYASDKQQMEKMAVNDIPHIGGWFAIQFYRELLSPEARVRYMLAKKAPAADPGAMTEPRLWALAMLPKIAPNPPVGVIDSSAGREELQRHAQIWRDWIRANQAKLQKLQPTGIGVDFSGKSCRGSSRPIPARMLRQQ